MPRRNPRTTRHRPDAPPTVTDPNIAEMEAAASRQREAADEQARLQTEKETNEGRVRPLVPILDAINAALRSIDCPDYNLTTESIPAAAARLSAELPALRAAAEAAGLLPAIETWNPPNTDQARRLKQALLAGWTQAQILSLLSLPRRCDFHDAPQSLLNWLLYWRLGIVVEPQPARQSPSPTIPDGAIPRWDGRKLWYGSTVCCQMRAGSKMVQILDAFEELKWQTAIDSPFVRGELTPRRRIKFNRQSAGL